ncbi:hypothetical protein [Candidatus Electronema sp. PJ]|uniref:hypothetical protein n=1 Tax=Candidatus Electronema sp. PJ TaxID=3401572 RepID=UPI003AA9662E
MFHRCFERSFMVELRAATLPSAARDKSNSKRLEYRIIAINKAGDSLPSNTVTVVL